MDALINNKLGTFNETNNPEIVDPNNIEFIVERLDSQMNTETD